MAELLARKTEVTIARMARTAKKSMGPTYQQMHL